VQIEAIKNSAAEPGRSITAGNCNPLLRFWRALYLRTPNFRGKGKLFFDKPCRLVRNWPSDVSIPGRHGCTFFHCDLNESMYRFLFFYGIHELDVDWICSHVLQSADVFVDIGACFGYHTISSALRVGITGQVYALEPQPDMFGSLRNNLVGNNLSNVTADHLALSDQAETLHLHRFADLGIGHTSISSQGREVSQVISTAAVTLDAYVERRGIKSVTLVKLDVEGAELKVLRGATGLLSASSPPMWVLEINDETAGACGYHPRDLLALLAQYGYSFYQPVWGRMIRTVVRLAPCSADCIHNGMNLLCAIPALHADRLAHVGVA
jgi:FkbM family methyltransferase